MFQIVLLELLHKNQDHIFYLLNIKIELNNNGNTIDNENVETNTNAENLLRTEPNQKNKKKITDLQL